MDDKELTKRLGTAWEQILCGLPDAHPGSTWEAQLREMDEAVREIELRALSLESVRSEADAGLFAAGRMLGFMMGLEEAEKVCELEAEAHRSTENHKMRTPAGRQGAIAQEIEARNCATLIRALHSPARVAEARPEWDGYIRFDSDCVVNGTKVKAGTSWGPFEKSKNITKSPASEDVHSTELRK